MRAIIPVSVSPMILSIWGLNKNTISDLNSNGTKRFRYHGIMLDILKGRGADPGSAPRYIENYVWAAI
jgi:hypothetical protein